MLAYPHPLLMFGLIVLVSIIAWLRLAVRSNDHIADHWIGCWLWSTRLDKKFPTHLRGRWWMDFAVLIVSILGLQWMIWTILLDTMPRPTKEQMSRLEPFLWWQNVVQALTVAFMLIAAARWIYEKYIRKKATDNKSTNSTRQPGEDK
jgi:hypothetical protein